MKLLLLSTFPAFTAAQSDIEGNFKNVAITVGQLEKALNNDCMFDCSLVEGMLPTDNADVGLPFSSALKRKNSHSGPTSKVYPISAA